MDIRVFEQNVASNCQYNVSTERIVLRDFRWFIRHLRSMVKSAALKNSCYPQVPGSIPSENTSAQIRMDLSK